MVEGISQVWLAFWVPVILIWLVELCRLQLLFIDEEGRWPFFNLFQVFQLVEESQEPAPDGMWQLCKHGMRTRVRWADTACLGTPECRHCILEHQHLGTLVRSYFSYNTSMQTFCLGMPARRHEDAGILECKHPGTPASRFCIFERQHVSAVAIGVLKNDDLFLLGKTVWLPFHHLVVDYLDSINQLSIN